MTKEWYRDLEKRNVLQERLEKAGLPKIAWASGLRICAGNPLELGIPGSADKRLTKIHAKDTVWLSRRRKNGGPSHGQDRSGGLCQTNFLGFPRLW